MLHDRLHVTLKHLGINNSNYKVLKLLPLIYVAWADGGIEPEQERRILHVAREQFQIGAKGDKILRSWLEKRPTKEYFQEGLHDLLLLASAPDCPDFDVEELPGLLAYSEAIARTTAQAMDFPSAVDANEEQALVDIARELNVDDGESWAKLLEELKQSPA